MVLVASHLKMFVHEMRIDIANKPRKRVEAQAEAKNIGNVSTGVIMS